MCQIHGVGWEWVDNEFSDLYIVVCHIEPVPRGGRWKKRNLF